ncbi:hypothetical protein [Arthrobacter sp. H5]|nr:hypothetical protein [Arthrobacter sp. H5]
MAFVRLLKDLMRDKSIGSRIRPRTWPRT